MDTVRSDLDSVMPKLAMLPDEKPEAEARTVVKAPVAAQKPVVKAAVEKAVKPAVGGPLRVVGVRTGVHPGKYRMVFDLSGAAKFTYDLDNNENLLLIEVVGVGWDAPLKKALAESALVSGYSVSVDDGVTRVAVSLAGPAKVLMAQAFEPNHVYGHRLVFDIAAQ